MDASINSKDIVLEKVDLSTVPYRFIIVHDHGFCENLAKAINVLDTYGWKVVDIWGTQSTTRALFRRDSGPSQDRP